MIPDKFILLGEKDQNGDIENATGAILKFTNYSLIYKYMYKDAFICAIHLVSSNDLIYNRKTLCNEDWMEDIDLYFDGNTQSEVSESLFSVILNGLPY